MIPMVDLKTQYELLKSEINEAINEVLVVRISFKDLT